MTIGVKLLDLTIEYAESKDNRSDGWAAYPGQPAGRAPEVIAAEYAATLKELLA